MSGFLFRMIKPTLAKMRIPPKIVWPLSLSPKKLPTKTATSGVTKAIIMALVTSILLKSQ